MTTKQQELKTCNRCGMENLHWDEVGGRKRLLMEDGDIHPCYVPCRKGCGELIAFATTHTNARMPIDVDSMSPGDIEDWTNGVDIDYRPDGHTSHFDTCTESKKK